MRKAITSLLLMIICSLILMRPAFAYLDPGTASMLLQGIIGGIAAAGAVISLNYQRFKYAVLSMFRKKDGEEKK